MAEEHLVFCHHPTADPLGHQAAVVVLVMLHGPGERHTQPRVRVNDLGPPGPQLGREESSRERYDKPAADGYRLTTAITPSK